MKRTSVAIAMILGLAAQAAGAQSAPPDPVPPDIQHALDHGPKGVLAIRVLQGTRDGPPVGGEEAEITLFHRETPVRQIKATVAEQGLVMLTDLPVGIGVRPLVRVRHAGVLYQDAGPEMDASRPQASMDLTVYEVTDEQPPWRVVMRHVAAAATASGLDVAETVVVENPGDRTWLGGAPDSRGRRAAVALTLPPRAANIQLVQGFHGWCCTAYENDALLIQMPLMPGRATYRFAYHVPAQGGVADLRVAAPVRVEHAAFFVPEGISMAEVAGLRQAGTDSMGGQRVRLLQGDALADGQRFGLVLTGLGAASPPSPPTTPPAPPPRGWPSSALVAGALAALIAGVIIGRRLGARTRAGPPP